MPLVSRSAGDLENQKQLEQIVWVIKEDEREATIMFHCTEMGDWELSSILWLERGCTDSMVEDQSSALLPGEGPPVLQRMVQPTRNQLG